MYVRVYTPPHHLPTHHTHTTPHTHTRPHKSTHLHLPAVTMGGSTHPGGGGGLHAPGGTFHAPRGDVPRARGDVPRAPKGRSIHTCSGGSSKVSISHLQHCPHVHTLNPAIYPHALVKPTIHHGPAEVPLPLNAERVRWERDLSGAVLAAGAWPIIVAIITCTPKSYLKLGKEGGGQKY